MSWPFAAPAGSRGPGSHGGGRHETRAVADRWAGDGEAFPGAAALDDVLRGLPAGEAAARVAVVRFALAAGSGRADAPLLERERAAVRGYVGASGCRREEAAALESALALSVPGPGAVLAAALSRAAAAALAGGCSGGAESLWRAAYALAAPRAWHAEVVVAAEALAALARSGGSRSAATLWRQRAYRHGRCLPPRTGGEAGPE